MYKRQELGDNCECASYDPWRPDCRYPSCGQCNCDSWHNPLTDDCCSAHCWQECWDEARGKLPGPDAAAHAWTVNRTNVTDRATGTTCWNDSPLDMGETVLRCPAGQYSQHEGSCVCVADQTLPEPPRCLLRDHASWSWHGWDVNSFAFDINLYGEYSLNAQNGCDALRCDPATETIFFAGYSKWDDHWLSLIHI